jgi:hypothetical protein
VEKPITTVAFEAAVIDWLPLARIPSWPGAECPNRTRPKIRLQSDSCWQLTRIHNGPALGLEYRKPSRATTAGGAMS